MSVSLMGQSIRHLREKRWNEYSVTTCKIPSLQTFLKEELWPGVPLRLFNHECITSCPPPLYASQPTTSKKHAAVDVWVPMQDPSYECALQLQASGTWEKKAASYRSSWSTCMLQLLSFTYSKCKTTTMETMNTWKQHKFLNKLEVKAETQRNKKMIFCYLF